MPGQGRREGKGRGGRGSRRDGGDFGDSEMDICKILVYRVKHEFPTAEEIRAHFEQCGSVSNVEIGPRETAIVTFAQPGDAAWACSQLQDVTMYTHSMEALQLNV